MVALKAKKLVIPRCLFIVLAGFFLLVPPCFAQARGPIRPASKEAKLGARGKAYVVLREPYFWSEKGPVGLIITEGLPAGIYRIKFEDDAGYYLPAPGKIGSKIADAVYPSEGGLYVRKDKPTVFSRYSTFLATGAIDPATRKLPWDFATKLQQ